MRKIVLMALLGISILAACNSSTLSFSEIENVPNNVQEKVDATVRLQSITDGGKGYYIVFHSRGDVEANLETEGNTVTIKFNETNPQAGVVKQNTYYLTTDREHDTIDVQVNGESIPFDNVIAQ
ncbi:hypothetical protein [Ureibacillus sinduriensis]|uniref:Peptidylprolyl isomerase n=1 Tax=Ureibacillus sinduriensis BLB-1 = JCM 15800 TaxID=1384057 RepID=A0A0A3ING0_9BACL|nr:hypothetical protein [Ureibacillus sinduriensis]KGR76372.1 hypothetical protein CD33_07470 [Ureibacillus sinduriensis BLB-1 = JCM 15800]